MSTLQGRPSSDDSQTEWLPVSDIMSGLMMVFMLIAIVYANRAVEDRKRVEAVAENYNTVRIQLRDALRNEFAAEIKANKIEFDEVALSLRFGEESFFAQGRAVLEDTKKEKLNDFFPRYLRVLADPKYRSNVQEIRIEGHTSPEWNLDPNVDPYQANMELSQARTRAVLQHCLQLAGTERGWLVERMTANGLSSSKPVLGPDNQIDASRSRRVEFRVVTNAEQQIAEILKLTDRSEAMK